MFDNNVWNDLFLNLSLFTFPDAFNPVTFFIFAGHVIRQSPTLSWRPTYICVYIRTLPYKYKRWLCVTEQTHVPPMYIICLRYLCIWSWTLNNRDRGSGWIPRSTHSLTRSPSSFIWTSTWAHYQKWGSSSLSLSGLGINLSDDFWGIYTVKFC